MRHLFKPTKALAETLLTNEETEFGQVTNNNRVNWVCLSAPDH